MSGVSVSTVSSALAMGISQRMRLTALPLRNFRSTDPWISGIVYSSSLSDQPLIRELFMPGFMSLQLAPYSDLGTRLSYSAAQPLPA